MLPVLEPAVAAGIRRIEAVAGQSAIDYMHQLGEQIENEPYIALIKRLAVKDKLDFDTAKLLINEYKKLREGNK